MPLEYKLRAKPYEIALRDSLEAFTPIPSYELVPVTEALGRRLAVDIVTPYDIPRKNIAFYDGYAVRHEDTKGATASSPVRLRLIGSVLKDGEEIGLRVEGGMAVYVSAGSPLPEGADAVVREELASREGGMVSVKKEVEMFEDTVLRGEDVKKSEILIGKGAVIRPQDQALLLEMGFTRIYVYKEPTIAIASIGDELLERFEKGVPYPDNYSLLLVSILRLLGTRPAYLGIIRDDPEVIADTVSKNIKHYDSIALIGGASRGVKDYSGIAMENIGETIFHGTTLSPGKVSGVCKVDGKPVILIPGHIGSAICCIYNILLPIISKIHYDSVELLPKVSAKLTSTVEARPGAYTFRTVGLEWRNGFLLAIPHVKRLGGSTLLTVFSKAGGYILIPPSAKLLEGEIVRVTLLSSLETFNWR